MRWAGFGLAALVRALRRGKARAFQPVVPARQRRTGTSPPARRTGEGRYPVRRVMKQRTQCAQLGVCSEGGRGFWIPAFAGMTSG